MLSDFISSDRVVLASFMRPITFFSVSSWNLGEKSLRPLIECISVCDQNLSRSYDGCDVSKMIIIFDGSGEERLDVKI